MIYIITIVVFSVYLLLMKKKKSISAYVVMIGFLTAYGRYVFQNFDYWYKEYQWNRIAQESDGTLTYSFVAHAMEPSLTNPVYLDHVIMQANYSAWWIIWPVLFFVLLAFSKYIFRGN
ncbi:hypothetical protein [Thalassolituus oleivorans]|uniref:hypothetical protein n=1 Tax=Thalassolituus oleivorans TaxID=187493 RepID=UPI0024090465|nr:hypothetical protein [Thalassolituus oleivorans]MDF1642478.1 hypothetical protein [Thalassolituus oleivorans]